MCIQPSLSHSETLYVFGFGCVWVGSFVRCFFFLFLQNYMEILYFILFFASLSHLSSHATTNTSIKCTSAVVSMFRCSDVREFVNDTMCAFHFIRCHQIEWMCKFCFLIRFTFWNLLTFVHQPHKKIHLANIFNQKRTQIHQIRRQILQKKKKQNTFLKHHILNFVERMHFPPFVGRCACCCCCNNCSEKEKV